MTTDVEYYRKTVRKILSGLKLDIGYERTEHIVSQIVIVDKMVFFANDCNPDNGLKSTQVIAKIVLDCLNDMQINWFV
jgi:hypothetical protein